MATHNGILGNVSGKIGPVVGSSWNGIQYFRSLPRSRSGTRLSEMQLMRQARFALGMQFIQAMGDLVNISYQSGYGKTARNAALSRILSQAVGGTYPDLYIDYSAVEIARGELKKAANPAVSLAPGQQLRFTWTDNTGMGTAAATDPAILAAYCPETNNLLWTANAGPRSAAEGLLDIRVLMKVIQGRGYTLHTLMAFRSEDGRRVADGVYTGRMQLD